MKIFLIGFMGSGKTYWGRLLSIKLGLPFFDLDEQIEANEGKTVNELFELHGEENFRLMEKDTLHIITESHESFVMSAGGGTPCYFNNIEFMNSRGTTVWINTPVELLTQRLVKEKDQRPLIKEFDEEQLKNFILKKYAGRKIYYEMAKIVVGEEDKTVEKIIEKVFHA
jgi:shikimate kinase